MCYSSIGTSKNIEPSSNIPSGHTEKEPIMVIKDVRDVLPLISKYLPTKEDRRQREDAIDLLKRILTNNSTSSHNLLLAPLGSYLMDTYFADSDVDILAIGSALLSAFFQHARVQLRDLAARESGGAGFRGIHLVNSLVSIIECAILGVKFDIQCCQAPELLARYRATETALDLKTLVFDTSLISSLSHSSLRPFNTYRDTVYIIQTCPDLSVFCLAHRFLSLYLKRRGLYSARFGYIGSIHLSLMLNRVVNLIARA